MPYSNRSLFSTCVLKVCTGNMPVHGSMEPKWYPSLFSPSGPETCFWNTIGGFFVSFNCSLIISKLLCEVITHTYLLSLRFTSDNCYPHKAWVMITKLRLCMHIIRAYKLHVVLIVCFFLFWKFLHNCRLQVKQQSLLGILRAFLWLHLGYVHGSGSRKLTTPQSSSTPYMDMEK